MRQATRLIAVAITLLWSAAAPAQDLVHFPSYEVLYAAGRAERVDGGYRFFGHKHFGSLSPVWNWLKIYGVDVADPDDPKIVHAIMARDTSGYRIVETWDTLGMRATASQDTIIEGAFVPDRQVIRVVKPGFAGADDFVLGLFGRFQPMIANMYIGLAERSSASRRRIPSPR